MTPLQKMTAEAEAAAARYDSLAHTWRTHYEHILGSGRLGSAKQMFTLKNQAYQIARTYLATETELIQAKFQEIALEAFSDTLRDLQSHDTVELTDAFYEHLLDAQEHLQRELTIQLERDVVLLGQILRRTTLQVMNMARASGRTIAEALMEYRIGSNSKLQFFFHDRANQKWASRKFVRAVWRHALLSVYNEAVLSVLADHKIDRAQVRHANPKATTNGLIISMGPNTEHPTYEEIFNEVFHPNSDALLGMVR